MKLESMPDVVGLQAGSLADPSRFVPAMDVFTSGAQPWDHMQPELPEAGVTYYEVPQEYGVREYRYTVVNDRPVLVTPRTRRIVEVVE
jgi:hypothetical protein